jgi:hypothetical protein
MGARVLSMTKFHPGMAGEGIEYLWGIVKPWYWSKPLHQKWKNASFEELVQGCLDPNLISKEKVRSKQARSYICAYYEFGPTKQNNTTNNKNDEPINHDDISILSCTIKYKKVVQMLVRCSELTVVHFILIGNSAMPM